MRLILDTHAFVWAAVSSHLLSPRAAEVMASGKNELLISAATAWEIATRVRLGRFPEAQELASNLVNLAAIAGYTFLAIDFKTALRSGRIPGAHGDPFDRMIAAHALELDLDVISNDRKLDSFGVRRMW